MVTIKYYTSIDEKPQIHECERVINFLSRFETRDELLDLRFFEDDILSHEINQEGGEFLEINEGVIAIIHNSIIPRDPATWIYVAIAVIAAVAAVALVPSVTLPESGRDQQSGTNTLGDSSNEPRVNGRIDDVFGTVTKHTPPLWQVPYRIGVNNQETEVLLCCVGRGRYEIDPSQWYDGDTSVVNIPNAAVNIYEPFKNPNIDMPDTVIGYNIDQEIGVYRQSNDINPSELLPPNDTETTGVDWLASGSGSNAILTATNVPEGFILTDKFTVGEMVTLSGVNYLSTKGSVTLTRKFSDPVSSTTFNTFNTPVDLGEDRGIEYEVLSVTSDTLTLLIPNTASVDVVNAWAAMSNYSLSDFYVLVAAPTIPLESYVISKEIESSQWIVSDGETEFDVVLTGGNYAIGVGSNFDNIVGPVITPSGATRAIFNFVSPNGFYKLVKNSEIALLMTISVTVYEIDENGNETGESTVFGTVHQSNTSVTQSVFNTYEIDLPYTLNKIYVERNTDRDKREDVSNVDVIEWRDMYTFEPVDVSDFGDVTLAHVVIPSNSQSRLIKQRKQNVTLTRKVTQYLGGGNFGPVESYATDQFDQILIHMALDPWNGRLSLDNINADGYMDMRDEIIAYFGSDEMSRFGYDFDSNNMTFQDIYMLIADAVMCRPYVQSGVYDLFFEKAQTVSSMQITCRNKIAGSEGRRINLDKENDGVEVTYRDNVTSVQETIFIPDNQTSTNPMVIELKGVTSELQATRRANREYNKLKYEIEHVKFEVDSFGRNIIPYKRIDSPDSTRFTKRPGVTNGYRVYDGEVIEVSGLQVELSEPVEFVDGEDHYITFTKANGDNSEVILCTQIDDYNVLLLSMPVEPIYDGYSRDRTKYILVSEQLRESMALIPKTIEFNISDDNVETHTVNAVNYTDKYYQNDLDTLE